LVGFEGQTSAVVLGGPCPLDWVRAASPPLHLPSPLGASGQPIGGIFGEGASGALPASGICPLDFLTIKPGSAGSPGGVRRVPLPRAQTKTRTAIRFCIMATFKTWKGPHRVTTLGLSMKWISMIIFQTVRRNWAHPAGSGSSDPGQLPVVFLLSLLYEFGRV